jgi:proline iminopeptidase
MTEGKGIEEGSFVEVRGVEQWVTILGQDRSNPVLLIIPGFGAGFTSLAPFFRPWEHDFTLVYWDQPRAGATAWRHGSNDGGELSVERVVRDGIAVVEHICRRLGVSKVAVLAMSAGTITALHMVRRRPDLFAAYVGAGQLVNFPRQDALSYRMLLDHARAVGNAEMLADLERIGPPPYPDAATDLVKSKYAGALTPGEQGAFAAAGPVVMGAVMSPPPDARWLPAGAVLGDVRVTAMAAYEALRNDIVLFDARTLGLGFDVPMFFLQGDLDAMTISSEVRDYAAELRAPVNRFVSIAGGGHSPFFMRDAFLAALNEHVRPACMTPMHR